MEYTMRIFGYDKNSVEDDNLLELEEITIQASPAKLKQIAKFILSVADTMNQYGNNFGHEHLKDFLKEFGDSDGPDIIIAK